MNSLPPVQSSEEPLNDASVDDVDIDEVIVDVQLAEAVDDVEIKVDEPVGKVELVAEEKEVTVYVFLSVWKRRVTDLISP